MSRQPSLGPNRPVIAVRSAEGGWPHPWPNVAEIADAFPSHQWTLVGGLMTQLHTVHRGLGIVRPTNDVDIVLHIETGRGLPNQAATALESLGYRLQTSIDPRTNTAHRWLRDGQAIDVVGAARDLEVDPTRAVVDVLRADHSAPKMVERMRGRDLLPIDGGTQALRRTVNVVLDIRPDGPTIISVPRPFAAVILKAAAFLSDARDPGRHLLDAAALLACIDAPLTETQHLAGSDRHRIRTLVDRLPDDHSAWLRLDPLARREAQTALGILGTA